MLQLLTPDFNWRLLLKIIQIALQSLTIESLKFKSLFLISACRLMMDKFTAYCLATKALIVSCVQKMHMPNSINVS